MEICEKGTCTGCSACFAICPVNAIKMVQNKNGFYMPSIYEDICIKCMKCQQVCPSNTPTLKHTTNCAYACKNKNKKIKKESSSGGIFTLLANQCIANDGVVFGAVMSNNCTKVEHIGISSKSELADLRGSKYLQSDIKNTYRETKEHLKNDRKVLYSGTPCQIAGLKNYLGKEYTNLFTVDLICHGTPSQKVFKKYTEYISRKLGTKRLVSYHFRNKDKGWATSSTKAIGDNGKIYCKRNIEDLFYHTFNKEIFLNEACHQCKYTTYDRVSDITLADYWGYIPKYYKLRDDNKGISAIIVNTTKGDKLFKNNSSNIIYAKTEIDQISKSNRSLLMSWAKSKRSDEFWTRFHKGENIEELLLSFCEFESVYKDRAVQRNVKNMLLLFPDSIDKIIRKIIRK